MHYDACLVRGVVVDLAYLDFSILRGLEYRLDDFRRGFGERYLGDGKGGVVDFFDFGADKHFAAALAVVVAANVDETAGGEVGEERELLAAQMRHGGVDDFVEIVGKDGRRHAHGQTHHALE